MNLQGIVFDDRARPHPLKQFVFGDKLAGCHCQRFEDFECSPADWHDSPINTELAQL